MVEEGRLSDGWRSPLQRRLAADTDDLVLGSAVTANDTQGTEKDLASVRHGRDVREADGSDGDSFARGPEDAWRRERGLKSQDATEGHESCPLIYTVDATIAKKHGLILFQVRYRCTLTGLLAGRRCVHVFAALHCLVAVYSLADSRMVSAVVLLMSIGAYVRAGVFHSSCT